eukprot:4918878-Karenia_brevis.AAC.1
MTLVRHGSWFAKERKKGGVYVWCLPACISPPRAAPRLMREVPLRAEQVSSASGGMYSGLR